MPDALHPSPRRTRSRSRIAPDNADHPRQRIRSRTVSRLSLQDTQPDPDMYASQPTASQETPTFVEKRPRHKMTDYQLQRLEELYRADTHPSRGAKEALAAEVGMNVKSVLIWFQNRRQDRSKKTKAIVTPALARHVRTPSLEVKRTDPSKHASPFSRNAAARAKTATGGKASPLTSSRIGRLDEENMLATPHLAYQSPPWKDAYNHLRQPPSRPLGSISNTPQSERRSPDLWKHLPPTPPSRSRKPSRRPSCSPTRDSPLKPFGDASHSHLSLPSRPEKPTLEWACANSAARRKHGFAIYRDEDDSAGESTDLDDELGVSPWVPTSSSYWAEALAPGTDVDKKSPKERRVFREVTIPDEYHALFSPDLLLGASLLLTLKHSADDSI